MRYFFSVLLFTLLTTGCKQKVLSGKELEDKLKETMIEYLHKTMRSGTEVKIREMTWYPDKERKIYLCEFSVGVHTAASDTTGIMRASISQDFKTVTRTQ
jgi:hypothetical protein